MFLWGKAEYELNCGKNSNDSLQDTMNAVLKVSDAIDIVRQGQSITIVMPGQARVSRGGLAFRQPLEELLSIVNITRFGGKFADPAYKPFGYNFWIAS